MKLLRVILVLTIFSLVGCTKSIVQDKPTFDSLGKPTKICGIRAGDGRGPYEPLGRLSEDKCKREISKLCKKAKYKQIHRTKGHFARGKFGERIMIGTCP